MGGGTFTLNSFAEYSRSTGKLYSTTTKRVSGQVYHSSHLDKSLNPRNIMRECVNSKEHPNTVPVILGLDVTGSMGDACRETAEALGAMISDLYENYKDIEFCMMGIGDLDYDAAPIQMGQFESDVRIAKDLDKVFMEHGGGGNAFESYTAAWYMGLNHTKLDAVDKQGRKGIIITMGDEPLNPYLPAEPLNEATGDHNQEDIETDTLYAEASKKFDIYHISIDHRGVRADEKTTWGQLLGDNYKISSVNGLSSAIRECIDKSLSATPTVHFVEFVKEEAVKNAEIKSEGVPVISW